MPEEDFDRQLQEYICKWNIFANKGNTYFRYLLFRVRLLYLDAATEYRTDYSPLQMTIGVKKSPPPTKKTVQKGAFVV